MIHAIAAITALAQQCAPEIATEAVLPLIMTESGGDDLSININKGPRARAGSVAQGAALARRYIAAGHSVDVGLAQVNSNNFARLGVTIEQVFEPCTNLRLASLILQEGYARARRHYRGLDALAATYSLYNTGTLTRGFRNGYVNRIWSAASALSSNPKPSSTPTSLRRAVPTTPANGPTDSDSWVIGPIAATAITVFE